MRVIDWRPLFQGIIADIRAGANPGMISLKFHNSLVEAALPIVREAGQRKVVLSGGCFQNKYLSERMIRRLTENGFTPYWHHEVPPNDGGLCIGQALGASVL
jgi:hydrogenase maturation protein HypF